MQMKALLYINSIAPNEMCSTEYLVPSKALIIEHEHFKAIHQLTVLAQDHYSSFS